VGKRKDEKIDFRDLSLREAPVIKVIPPGPNSKELLDYQLDHESSAVSYAKGMPMALKRAKGATVEDVDGNVYIDCFGGAGVMAFGHANPVVLQAAHEQIDLVTHSLDIPTPARRALEEELFKVLPKELTRVFFGGPTGSDAVEQALKLAKYNTGRIPFISFEGGYHGMTAGGLTLTTTRSHKEGLLPLIPEVHYTPYAYCYRCAFGKQMDSCDLECAKYLEHLLEDPHSGVLPPAAVIIEAIQGEGGSIIPPARFLPEVRKICDRHEVLLICDEIQSGLGRTGKMFAFEHSGVVPDIVTISKALGGLGFPISAIAFREKLNTWPTALTIGTFRGNMVAFAAGARALRFALETQLLAHTEKIGALALNLLKDVEKDSSIIGEARGKGLMLGVELVHDKITKKPAPELAKRMRTLCHQRGVMIEVGGHYGNVARFLPPLVITRDLMSKGIEIFADAVREIEKS
jgi:diaminobutyrate-2-oxoglutarate transaminase